MWAVALVRPPFSLLLPACTIDLCEVSAGPCRQIQITFQKSRESALHRERVQGIFMTPMQCAFGVCCHAPTDISLQGRNLHESHELERYVVRHAPIEYSLQGWHLHDTMRCDVFVLEHRGHFMPKGHPCTSAAPRINCCS